MQNRSLSDIVSGFLESYANRDKNVEFSEWLVGMLQKELPDLAGEACKKIAGEILSGVSRYDEKLGEADRSAESGKSLESWLAEQTEKGCTEMGMAEKGDLLQQFDDGLFLSDMQLMGESGIAQDAGLPAGEIGTEEQWDEYAINNILHGIGEKAVLGGIAAVANVIRIKLENGDEIGVGEAVAEAVLDGIVTDSSDVKAAIAGAVKVAAEIGLEKGFSGDLSVDAICNIAGVAAEGAGAIYEAVRGEISVTEAVDKVGLACAAAAGNALAIGLDRFVLAEFPVVGPILTDLLGGLFKHLESEKFADNLYHLFKEAAVDTWEGIKTSETAKGAQKMQKLLSGANMSEI